MIECICKPTDLKNRKKRTLCSPTFIPFSLRVEILEFHEFEANGTTTLYDFYGYFTKDWTRKIYQVFTTLKVDCDFVPSVHVIPIKSSRNVEIIAESGAPKMKSIVNSSVLTNIQIIARQIPSRIFFDISNLSNVRKLFLGAIEFKIEDLQKLLETKKKYQLDNLRVDNCERLYREMDAGEVDLYRVRKSLILCKFFVTCSNIGRKGKFQNLNQFIFQFCKVDHKFLRYLTTCEKLKYLQFGDTEFDRLSLDYLISNDLCSIVKRIVVAGCWIKEKEIFAFTCDHLKEEGEKKGYLKEYKFTISAFGDVIKSIIPLLNHLRKLRALSFRQVILSDDILNIQNSGLKKIVFKNATLSKEEYCWFMKNLPADLKCKGLKFLPPKNGEM